MTGSMVATALALATAACPSYDQATPHRNDARAGGDGLCSGTELERRAWRALARFEQKEPEGLAVGEILFDLAVMCRKAGQTARAQALLTRSRSVLEPLLSPTDPRRGALEREIREAAPAR